MDTLFCPKDGSTYPEDAKFCELCGTRLISLYYQSAGSNESGLKNANRIKKTEVVASSSGSSCYKCNRTNILGTCIKDRHPFCSRHGAMFFERGYCRDCIQSAQLDTPWSIKVLAWIFYLGALGLLLTSIYFIFQIAVEGLSLYQQLSIFTRGTGIPIPEIIGSNSGVILKLVMIIIIVPILGAIILIILGNQISKGSVIGIGLLIIFTILFLFSRAWLFGLAGLAVLILNQHWLIMKRLRITPNVGD